MFHFKFHPKIFELFKNFTEFHDIRIAFFSPEGEEQIVGINKGVCGYCKYLIKQSDGFGEKCMLLDKQKREESKLKKRMVSYICHGGLNEAIKPVFAGNILIGYVMIGQFRTRKVIQSDILPFSFSKSQMAKLSLLYYDLPFVHPQKLDNLLNLFSILVDYMVSENLVQLHDKDSIQNLMVAMHENTRKDFTLDTAARYICRSKSRTSHFFKEVYGKSFTEVKHEIKMNKAKYLIRNFPDMSVKNVAWELGYNDPLYFSKRFKSFFGISPTRFRSQSKRK